jgi:hypothetical protein
VRESLRIIEHTHHPEMIETSLGLRRIKTPEANRQRLAGPINGGDLGSAEIKRFYVTLEVKGFHEERWELRDTGSHIEAPSMRVEAIGQRTGDPAPQSFTGPPLGLPELLASFVAIHRAEFFVVQMGKDPGDGGSR